MHQGRNPRGGGGTFTSRFLPLKSSAAPAIRDQALRHFDRGCVATHFQPARPVAESTVAHSILAERKRRKPPPRATGGAPSPIVLCRYDGPAPPQIQHTRCEMIAFLIFGGRASRNNSAAPLNDFLSQWNTGEHFAPSAPVEMKTPSCLPKQSAPMWHRRTNKNKDAPCHPNNPRGSPSTL